MEAVKKFMIPEALMFIQKRLSVNCFTKQKGHSFLSGPRFLKQTDRLIRDN